MRLVIDCFKLIKGVGKSIGIYNVALGVVKHLGALNSLSGRNDAEIIVLGNSENREDFKVKGVKFVEIKSYDPTNKLHVLMWELFHVSRVCRRLKADRVFFPRGFSALTHPVYDIVLIHDLIPFYYNENFPGFFNRLENAYIMWRLRQSAKSAKKVVTISQASKQDIIKYCGVDENKIVVINNACEEISVRAEKAEKPYICAMTSGLPHKNACGIIDTYVKYCETAAEPIDLVVIGLQDTEGFGVPDEIKEKITCRKFIKSNDEMYRIIGGSEVFLFLSLVEGFGLPPIEAMQLGVPVVCSDTSSLPEVVGDAAIKVSPTSAQQAAEGIISLLENKELKKRLTDLGRENVRRFRWETVIEKYRKELLF